MYIRYILQISIGMQNLEFRIYAFLFFLLLDKTM